MHVFIDRCAGSGLLVNPRPKVLDTDKDAMTSGDPQNICYLQVKCH